jgi:hypothetical protein
MWWNLNFIIRLLTWLISAICRARDADRDGADFASALALRAGTPGKPSSYSLAYVN